MALEDDEEIEMLRRTVRGFVVQSLRRHEADVDAADEIPADLIKGLRQEAVKLGLFGYNMPVELNGPGLSRRAICAVDEEMGHTSMPLAEAAGHLPGSLVFCNDEQRKTIVGPLMRGETSIAYALTEPDAGSDLGGINTRAERRGNGWLLEGTKHYISHAETAEHTIVLAVTDRSASLRSRFSTFIVPRSWPGFKVGRRFRKMGWRGYPLSELTFAECELQDSHLLGAPGDGFRVIMATVNNDRLFVGCRCVGMAQEMMDQVLPWLKERKTFGARLGDHQAIQMMLADCDVELQAGRLLCRAAADMADRAGPEYRIAASRAKLYCSEMAGRVADRVLQMFGGAGFMTDLPIERFYRDVRGFRIGEGTSEMQRLQIARHVLE